MRLDGFRLQLLVLIVLPLSALLLVLAFGGTRVHSHTMRRLVAERDERTTRVAADLIAETLRHRRSQVSTLAQSPDLMGMDHKELAGRLDGTLGVAVLGEDGRLLAGDLKVSAPLDELAARIRETPDLPLLLEPRSGNGRQAVVVAAKASAGSVVASYGLDVFLPSLAAVGAVLNLDLRVYVVDGDGRMVSLLGAGLTERVAADHPGIQAALGGVSGFTYAPAPDGEHVIAYSPVPAGRWALILEEPWEAVASPLLDLSMAAPLALAPALVVTLIVLWFGARSVVLPLRELERQAIRMSAGEMGAALVPVRGIGEIRQLQRTLSEMGARVTAANRALRAYLDRITTAQEEERTRIARELHDETVQQLIALDQRLQLLDADLKGRGHIEPERLTELREAAGRAIRDVRRLTRGLRPDYLEDLGLSAALGVLAGEAQAAYGLGVDFEAQGTAFRLSSGTELAVYRVVQEALTNIGRHASAAHAEIRLTYTAAELRLTVRDDGQGFELPEDVQDLGKAGHWGLIGMRERAASLGGRLEVRSSRGAGTWIELTLPPRSQQGTDLPRLPRNPAC